MWKVKRIWRLGVRFRLVLDGHGQGRVRGGFGVVFWNEVMMSVVSYACRVFVSA